MYELHSTWNLQIPANVTLYMVLNFRMHYVTLQSQTGQPVTHYLLPAAVKSSPVHFSPRRLPVYLLQHWGEAVSSPAKLLNQIPMIHIRTEGKIEKYLSEVAFFAISNSESAQQMWAGRIQPSTVAHWGFYGEIKEKPRRLSSIQLTFQVRLWCWLQPTNWRHIWKTYHCVPNGLSPTANPGARETSSGRMPFRTTGRKEK